MTAPSAIILTGGRGRRLGGVDKAAIRVQGATLLDHALAAASSCAHVVVVGPPVSGYPQVTFAREEPPGGGPVAGIGAGLAALEADGAEVLVLACDMPYAREVVPRLLAALAAAPAAVDGVWGIDDDGRTQPLCAVYRRHVLDRALTGLGDMRGASMRALASGLTMHDVPVGDATRDADTWDDVRALREEQR